MPSLAHLPNRTRARVVRVSPERKRLLALGLRPGAGVETVLSFTPVLFLLYLALAFLETSGFLARMAFVADRLMRWAGLPGKAFIPLVLGFGCNVPAVYATQALAHPLDRLRVALAIPSWPAGRGCRPSPFSPSPSFPKTPPWWSSASTSWGSA